MNTVNPDNFNDTLMGYIIRALKDSNLNKEDQKKVLVGLRWALSEMTMEDARREYKNYCLGKGV